MSPPSVKPTKNASRQRGSKKQLDKEDRSTPYQPPHEPEQNMWHLESSTDVLQSESRAKSGMRTSLAAFAAAFDVGVSGISSHGASIQTKHSDQSSLLLRRTDQQIRAKVGTDYTGEIQSAFETPLNFSMPAPLRELIELRGFLPTATRIEVYI